MSRRCSHCGHNGHNSRTCVEMKGPGGFKLFGVRLSTDPPSSSSSPFAVAAAADGFSSSSMRKSFSMGNLSNYCVQEGEASPPSPSPQEQPDMTDTVDGYASDDLVHTNSNSRERKKGVPWTEEEHRNFLIGLQKLGKGDWRGISRNFVKTRTPTQVASHAQKYFLRRNNLNKRRRRSSLFDITPDTVSSFIGEPLLEETNDPDACPELSLGQNIPYGRGMNTSVFSQSSYPVGGFSVPMQRMHLPPIPVLEEAGETVEAQEVSENDEMAEVAENDVDLMESVPEDCDDSERGVDQLTLQFPLMPMWPGQNIYAPKPDIWNADSKLVRPTPIIPKPPAKASDTENSSEATRPVMEPSPLSYKLLEEHSRHSAFHTTSTSSGNREIDGQGSLGNAISVP